MKPEAFIFDLDGTLANLEHRRHHVIKPNRRWNQFFDECGKDAPISDVISIYNILAQHEYSMLVVSGRSDRVRVQTRAWLAANNLGTADLFMRRDGDYRADDIIKREIYETLILPSYNVIGVFDDRDRVVRMWRDLGLRCYQVAPGDF
jgi:phosphoglycolate phosphatase-like HAD superfamily hydrolase